MEPRSGGSPASPGMPLSASDMLPTPSEELPASEEAVVKTGRHSSSSSSSSSSGESELESESLFHDVDAVENAIRSPLVAVPDNSDAAAGDGAEAQAQPELPNDWASWPEQPPPRTTADEDPLLSNGDTVFAEVAMAPEVVQTMPDPGAPVPEVEVESGFDPERIPASVFHTKSSSSSHAEWSVASNESLFSIHGGGHSGELYAGSRSPFDYFYDEAMAASMGGSEPDWKLPTVAEGPEPADTAGGGHGSARSDASTGSGVGRANKKAFALRRHESGSDGSSSNFSFAFPILAETSPRKKESGGGRGGALYQPLQKECERPPPLPAPAMSAFEEMTTEEERRRRRGWCCCCGECCGCCWFACSWSSCCCCCRWRWWWWCCDWRWWWCCDCSCRCCSCPGLCRCDWCLCF